MKTILIYENGHRRAQDGHRRGVARRGVWLIYALFDFVLTVSDRMDDGGCYAGHPVWATAQLGVTVLGAVASVVCVYFLGSDRTPVRAAWGFAAASLMFCTWLVLVHSVPHAHLIAATC
jgi:hypothetical protein